VAGRVVALGDSRPIGAARISSELGPTASTDPAGQFSIGGDTNPPTNPHAFTIEAQGFLTRVGQVTRQTGTRDGVVFDLIPLAAPFSLEFYRAMVRNTFDAPSGMEPLRRWIANPNVYVRTVDQDGRAIEPEVIATVLATIPDAVRDFTGGRISVARLESGTEARTPTTNWIAVDILRDPASTVCGRAQVGGNPGQITLYNDRCGCGSNKIRGRTIAHEVGHALGFWHVGDRNAVMYPQASGSCPIGTLTASERFHAGLAYQRAPGNLDPDRDPTSAALAMAEEMAPPTVTCFTRGRS